MAKSPYRKSPKGIAVYPWVNNPDTKFNDDGVYQTGLRLIGEDAQEFKAVIDGHVKASFEEITGELPKGEVRKWSEYAPYDIEEDDDGNPNGAIIFNFRQRRVLLLPDGIKKTISIGIYDSKDNPSNIPIWGGAEICVLYKPRTVKVPSNKKAGTRLDFLKVQVLKIAERSTKGGFGEVEGGYVDEGETDFKEAVNISSPNTAASEY